MWKYQHTHKYASYVTWVLINANIISTEKMKFLYFGKFSVSFCLSELERDGFCQNPFFECLVAEVPEEHKSREGKIVDQSDRSLSYRRALNLSAFYVEGL